MQASSCRINSTEQPGNAAQLTAQPTTENPQLHTASDLLKSPAEAQHCLRFTLKGINNSRVQFMPPRQASKHCEPLQLLTSCPHASAYYCPCSCIVDPYALMQNQRLMIQFTAAFADIGALEHAKLVNCYRARCHGLLNGKEGLH